MDSNAKPDCNPHVLRNAIVDSFPSYPFHGPVMSGSHDPDVYETDADNLDKVLSGKEWRDLTAEFLDVNEDEYVLMTDSAVLAFLGAWLWRAVDNLGRKNGILDSLIYHLTFFGGSSSSNYGLWANGFRLLSQKQRDTIHRLLECAAAMASSNSDREDVLRALKNVNDNRPYDIQPTPQIIEGGA